MGKGRNIPIALQFEIWRKPCVVCGSPYHIKCDHIIPYSKGGPTTRENLQPLCHDCNHRKHNRRTNEQLREWVSGRGLEHFLVAVYREDTYFRGVYDRPTRADWAKHRPDRVAHAHELYAAFLKRTK